MWYLLFGEKSLKNLVNDFKNGQHSKLEDLKELKSNVYIIIK